MCCVGAREGDNASGRKECVCGGGGRGGIRRALEVGTGVKAIIADVWGRKDRPGEAIEGSQRLHFGVVSFYEAIQWMVLSRKFAKSAKSNADDFRD